MSVLLAYSWHMLRDFLVTRGGVNQISSGNLFCLDRHRLAPSFGRGNVRSASRANR